eukprot:CAMPEP_0171145126 /NCGR_PEP_ID=MMETSP0766_2-20121228/146904_1 /TAXON_ID=439317 /ORGANISM="Gambierdiscus australes, Strain CAWD 149" /LENGTH=220 /DNA_ID=CAMNT_0011609025 /DNA_START=43 /DNA_END=705 /DNA_ORIENTATION=+
MGLQQPKRPVGGAFGVYLTEKRGEFLKACEGQKASVVSKMVGEAWKKLTPTQQEPYQKKYAAAKAKFDNDMKAFLDAGGEKQQGPQALRAAKRKAKEGGKKAKKAKDAPKKPSGGGYGVFLAENRAEIVRSLPAGHRVSDVTIKAGQQWKALSASAKAPYEAKYRERLAEYQVALAEYKKSCTTAGVAEEDEDGEDEGCEDEDEEEEDEPKLKKRPGGAA